MAKLYRLIDGGQYVRNFDMSTEDGGIVTTGDVRKAIVFESPVPDWQLHRFEVEYLQEDSWMRHNRQPQLPLLI